MKCEPCKAWPVLDVTMVRLDVYYVSRRDVVICIRRGHSQNLAHTVKLAACALCPNHSLSETTPVLQLHKARTIFRNSTRIKTRTISAHQQLSSDRNAPCKPGNESDTCLQGHVYTLPTKDGPNHPEAVTPMYTESSSRLFIPNSTLSENLAKQLRRRQRTGGADLHYPQDKPS